MLPPFPYFPEYFVFGQYPLDGPSGAKPDPTPLSAAIKCRAAFDMPLVECDWILYSLFTQVIEHIQSFEKGNGNLYDIEIIGKAPGSSMALNRAQSGRRIVHGGGRIAHGVKRTKRAEG